MKALAIVRLGCACLAGGAVGAAADEIVLFDAATTPMASVASQSGGKIELRDGLLEVETEAGLFRSPHAPLPPGAPVRLRVRSRDISLALARPAEGATSVLNILPATVEAIGDGPDPAQVRVRLRAGSRHPPIQL